MSLNLIELESGQLVDADCICSVGPREKGWKEGGHVIMTRDNIGFAVTKSEYEAFRRLAFSSVEEFCTASGGNDFGDER